MNTIFDKPQWRWVLQADQQSVGDHDPLCNIFRSDRNDVIALGKVMLAPPTDVFPFIKAQGYKAGDESYFTIHIEGKRAYVTLYVMGLESPEDYPLFYWTPSTAPSWLKKYL